MLITLPSVVAPGPLGATLLTIDGRLAAALVVAVAAVAAGRAAAAFLPGTGPDRMNVFDDLGVDRARNARSRLFRRGKML